MVNNKNRQSGYIALSSVLITLALVMLIGMSSSLLSINDLLTSQSVKKSDVSNDLIEACCEDALLKLNNDNTINTSITLPEGSCSVTINSHVGDVWDFTVSGNLEGYYKNIRINATRGSTVAINSWVDL